MKLHRTIILFVLTAISMNVMAFEGKGFKILSEKIEMSKGIKGGFIPSDRSNINTNANIHSNTSLAQAYVQAHNAQTPVRVSVKLVGNHTINIINSTRQTQIYTYKFELEISGRYVRKTDQVKVAPGGYFTMSADSIMDITQYTVGLWMINVNTEVKGESSDRRTAAAVLTVTEH